MPIERRYGVCNTTDQVSCHLGIAVRRIGVSNVGKDSTVQGLGDCLANRGMIILFAGELDQFRLHPVHVLLVRHVEQSRIDHKILLVDGDDESFIQFGFSPFQK